MQVKERQNERNEMVLTQINDRGVDHPEVLRAMRSVERHCFVPKDERIYAYDDCPLPIGYGQTISQPYIVAFMTACIDPQKGYKVLEIGTGSGYQAAVLAEIVDSVYTVECVKELADLAKETLDRLGYRNVRIRTGDGYEGWPEQAPFDAIVVTAAVEAVPPPLLSQLRDGGKLIVPVGRPYFTQQLVLVEKMGTEFRSSNLLPVRFVPFNRF